MSIKLSTGLEVQDCDAGPIRVRSCPSNDPNRLGPLNAAHAADALADFFAGANQDLIFAYRHGDDGAWFYWTGRYWEQYHDMLLEADIRLILGNVAATKLKEIVRTMARIVPLSHNRLDRAGVVAFDNKILKFMPTTGLPEIVEDPVKEDYCTWYLPTSIKRIPTPQWTKMLSQRLPDAADRDCLQEQFGCAIFPAFNPQAFFTWYGEGNTGKSTMANTLRLLVGDDRWMTLKLAALSYQHATSALVGKFVNFDPESEHLDQAGEAVIKSITGGDGTLINRKNDPNMPSIRLPCKIIMASNNLAPHSDKSSGLQSRWVLVPFEQPITKPLPEHVVMARLKPELPGIAFWAFQGLLRVLRKGTRVQAFTQSVRATEIKEEHRHNSDPLLQFIEERVDVVPGAAAPAIEKKTLFQHYRNWCNNNGCKFPVKKHNFDTRIAAYCVERGILEPTHKPHRGARMWNNVTLKP